MQTQGKDIIIKCYIGTNGQQLNLTTSGFQFGTNKDRTLVTSVQQVIGEKPEAPLFSKAVQDEVQVWLDGNGVQKAQQDLVDREVAEEASDMPGSLDAMAKQLGPTVQSQLYQMMKAVLKGNLAAMPPSPVIETPTAYVEGVPVVEDAHGIKHRLPDPQLVAHPRVVHVDGGVLLDKGNGHKEFRADYDGSEDEQQEAAILFARDSGRTAGKSKQKR